MKTIALIMAVLFGATAVVAAEDDPDAAAIAMAVPNVRSIKKTSTGYLLDTTNGTRMVYQTSTGYTVQGGRNAGPVTIRQNSTGYTIAGDGAQNVPNVRTIKKTSTGFIVESPEGSRMAFRNSSGYTVQSSRTADSMIIRRNSGGYTVATRPSKTRPPSEPAGTATKR